VTAISQEPTELIFGDVSAPFGNDDNITEIQAPRDRGVDEVQSFTVGKDIVTGMNQAASSGLI